jgi:hypothetical protein
MYQHRQAKQPEVQRKEGQLHKRADLLLESNQSGKSTTRQQRLDYEDREAFL